MIWSRIILLILAALLVWPQGLLSPPTDRLAATGSAPAHAASAATGTSDGTATHAKSRKQRPDQKRASGKNAKQKGARTDKNKQNKQKSKSKKKHKKAKKRNDRKRKENGAAITQAEIEALVESAPPKLPALSVSDDPCGPGMIQLPKSGRCTHGPDAPPPGAPADPHRAPLTMVEARREMAAIACDGDGTSGFRIQVLYTRATTQSNRFTTYLNSIRAWAAGADTILRNSSLAAGAAEEMGFHFVLNDACQIDVLNVPLSPAAMQSFDTTIVELENLGFDRTDRIYLIFADTTSAGICGIGTQWSDDRDVPFNFNNRGPSYARADSICWDGHTAAHELMHNLGAVQDSAPNSSLGGHCIDEYDVMCYSDEPFEPEMEIVCTPEGTFEDRFDCGNNDYFDPAPPYTSYLATHWNTANNWFLTQDIPPGTDLEPPVVEWLTPAGNDETYEATSGTVALEASAEDDSGIAYVEFWLFDARTDDWELISEDFVAPYTSSIAVSSLRSGLNYLTADAYDTAGNWVDEGIWINRTSTQSEPPSPPAPPNPVPPAATPPVVALQASGTKVKKKQAVALTAAVSNAAVSDVSVEFRYCRGVSCTWEAAQSLGSAPSASPSVVWQASGKGAFTFLANVAGPSGSSLSNPVTIVVKDKKGKKKR